VKYSNIIEKFKTALYLFLEKFKTALYLFLIKDPTNVLNVFKSFVFNNIGLDHFYS
jgi:hypothetical protein